MPPHDARVKEIYLTICARPAQEQAELLDRLCAADPDLRAAVEQLLRQSTKSAPDSTHDTTAVLPQTERDDAGLTRSSPATPPTGIRTPASQAGSAKLHSPGRRDFSPGTVLADRYRIIAPLGKGGMGEVFRADDLRLGQTVALKFLPADTANDPASLARFYNEVRVAREVTHANVCRVYDVGEIAGEPFISMEYVDGEDLKTLLSRIGRLPVDKATQIARQLCAGLAAAHAKGVLHRDLKPANIMLDGRGQVRITDFGLAALRIEIQGNEARAGTPAYMAPEQLQGREASVRSDIYALGLVLYELFTGRPAFRAKSLADYIRLHTNETPSLPSSVVSEISPAVESVILRCLEKEARQRPGDALAVSRALPGGDPLAAALEAGQTPSPELVAAAGETGTITLGHCAVSLAAFFILLALNLWGVTCSPAVPQNSVPLAPAVLAEDARECASQLMAGQGDEAWGFDTNLDCTFASIPNKPGAPGEQVPQAASDSKPIRYVQWTPEPVAFWFRRAQGRLIPGSAKNLVFGSARVSQNDPPASRPGMLNMVFAPTGRLLGFEHHPDAAAMLADQPRAVDWQPILDRAGLANAKRLSCEPRLSARVFADRRSAWCIPDGGPNGGPIRIETACYRGVPTLFAVIDEIPTECRGNTFVFGTPEQRTAVMRATRSIALIALIAIAIPLVRQNLRLGRGDRRGAVRVAGAVFGIRMFAWFLAARHIPNLQAELLLISFAAVGALGEIALVWLFYIALEPYARRFWPQTLISWSRALAGRIRCPFVGRNILLGAVVGVAWSVLGKIDRLAPSWLGLPSRERIYDPEIMAGFLGARLGLAAALELLVESIYNALFFVLLVVLLRAVVRKPWIAAVGGVVLILPMYLPIGANPFISLFTIGLLGIGVGVWITIRYGLVALITASFVSGILSMFPLTLDSREWYADLSLFALLLVCAIAIFGFYTSRMRTPDLANP